MKYWAIMTADQWRRSMLGKSTGIDLSDGDDKETVEEAIEDASAAIEDFLRRPVIVQRSTLTLATTTLPHSERTTGRIRSNTHRQELKSDWMWDPSADDGGGKYVHYPGLRPIVEVKTDDVEIGPENLRFEADEQQPEVNYFGGYKRADQSLSDLQVRFPDLTQTPDDVPATIRRVCINIVTFELQRHEHGLVAMRSRSVSTGDVTSDVTRVDTDFYDRELSRIKPYSA